MIATLLSLVNEQKQLECEVQWTENKACANFNQKYPQLKRKKWRNIFGSLEKKQL